MLRTPEIGTLSIFHYPFSIPPALSILHYQFSINPMKPLYLAINQILTTLGAERCAAAMGVSVGRA
jgi:hypothetical protein